jgi:hypothetical protein
MAGGCTIPRALFVQWAEKIGKNGGSDDFSLISSSRGVMVYEGFNERISGAPAEFVALLNVRVMPQSNLVT